MNIDFELYRIKVNRLTHFEKMLLTMHSLYLAGLYFIFKVSLESWIGIIVGSVILISLSIGYLHFLLVASSYVIEIIKMEENLKIEHLKKKWQNYADKFEGTFTFISLSPTILTVIAIPLLAFIEYNTVNLILSLIISALYTILTLFYAVKPLFLLMKDLRSQIHI